MYGTLKKYAFWEKNLIHIWQVAVHGTRVFNVSSSDIKIININTCPYIGLQLHCDGKNRQ